MKALTLCLFGVLLGHECLAREQLLHVVNNDISAEKQYITKFYLIVDERDHIQSIQQRKYLEGNENALSEVEFSLSELHTEVTLKEQDGLQIITLDAHNLSAEHGGPITITYLKNGITGSFRKLNLFLNYQQGRWHLTSENNRIVDKLFIHANWVLFFGTIGIDKIEIIHSDPEISYN